MSSIDDKLDFNLSDEQKRIVFENLDENKKLSCLKAFKVAKKIKVEAKDMSAITKFLGIKITDCELGVFGSLDFLAKDEDIYNRLKNIYKEQKIPCENFIIITRNCQSNYLREMYICISILSISSPAWYSSKSHTNERSRFIFQTFCQNSCTAVTTLPFTINLAYFPLGIVITS